MHETRKVYRNIIAKALLALRAYDGTEASSENFLAALIELESFLKTHELTEKKAQKRFYPRARHACTVDVFLERVLHNYFRAKKVKDLLSGKSSIEGVVKLTLDAVILPPDPEAPGIIPGQGTEEIRKREFEPRTLELITLLEREGVYLDDCILTTGTLLPGMMREESYTIIEIPRLNRVVLINDQIGEATYVIYGMGSAQYFVTLTKVDLQENNGVKAKRIIRRSIAKWHAELHLYLFREDVWDESLPENTPNDPKPKMNVSKIDVIRQKVFADERINTPQKWLEIKIHSSSTRYKDDIEGVYDSDLKEILGLGLFALAGIFGLPPRQTILAICLIGRSIFGRDARIERAILELTATGDDIRQAVKESELADPQVWVDMTQADAFEVRILGKTMVRLASIFQSEGDFPQDIQTRECYSGLPKLYLAQAIFGKVPCIVQEMNNLTVTCDDIREAIKDTPWSDPQVWVDMTQAKASEVIILGKRIVALAGESLFNIEGNPCVRTLSRLLLARAIFGKVPCIERAILEKTATVDDIRLAIKETKWADPQVWVDMTQTKAKKVKILGHGMKRLCTMFGVQGNATLTLTRLYLAKAIFGEVPCIMQAILEETATADDVREAIKETEWGNLDIWLYDGNKAMQVKVLGRSITSLIKLFRLDENSQYNLENPFSRLSQLVLAQEFFGEKEELRKAILKEVATPDMIRDAIVKTPWGNPEVWLRMKLSHGSKKIPGEVYQSDVFVLGHGIVSLAKIFDIEGKVQGRVLPHLLLTQAIFGESDGLTEAIQQYKARFARKRLKSKKT